MANTLKFDRKEALESSMSLFWEKGYQGTSTRDLLKATNLNPGSLYGTFGSKKALLSESLDCYKASLENQFMISQAKHENSLNGLHDFIINILLNEKSPSHLCFIFKMQIELRGTDLEDVIKQSATIFEQWFLEAFTKAQSQGFLSTTNKPALLVKTFQTRLLGWRAFLAMNPDDLFIRSEIENYFSELGNI